ncbi:AraC family transcriptional regulator [Clostridium sp. C2-6-12]|uniref:helix-turn-helix domain-containing protein n=1 Tax=Clostridium sp. C2-6-12 TaxID=2698832 RepID=UPI00136DF8BC|nr:AraC family transcriptional regulator [Clostridium sp. C2-6-12]
MEWIQSMQKAINYIEDNLLEDINLEQVAKSVYSSNANFQRIFSIVTGITIGDYIRYRRLTLAGSELTTSDNKIVYIALKYGYETAESFTKAFIRFHGVTPSAAKKSMGKLKCFSPLSIQIDIRGGFNMERKVISNVPLITMSADGFAYLTSFTGALYGALKGLDEDINNPQLLAYSGFGNRFCWTEGKWIFGNEDFENCNETPFEIQSQLLDAIGWKVRRIDIQRDENGKPINIAEEQIREDFVNSLNKGISVLAQGITDDGCKHDYGVFYGYEDNGQKIIGWDYYQSNGEPFIRADWEKELKSYVILTEKTKPEIEKNCIIEAFKRIVEHSKKNEIRGKKVGFAAWRSFLRQLENDDFSKCSLHPSEDNPNDEHGVNSLEHRFIIYCDALCQINQRGQIVGYYRTLIEKYPEWAEELKIAINSWEECAKYGGFLWSQGFTFDEAGFEKFRDPKMRKILADEGYKAMYNDMEAIKQIEIILQNKI